jgi:hypothetical protein
MWLIFYVIKLLKSGSNLIYQKHISLYPHLIPIHAFAYDPWDDIIEPLFFEMVYNTFTYKYGISIKRKEAHNYNLTLNCFKGINHIQCIPKATIYQAFINEEWFEMEKNKERILIFKSFGDGVHFLTGGLDIHDAHKVGFDLVEVELVCTNTMVTTNSSYFVNIEDIDFVFIAESNNEDL